MTQPVSMGMWIKDGWLYMQQDETSYKMELDEDMNEFLDVYQEIMAQVGEMSDMSVAVMMPYLKEITAVKSGSDTIYTLTINEDAFMGMINDAVAMISSVLGEELSLGLDMGLTDCTYTYTVNSRGQLKNVTAAANLNMKMDMSEGEETVAMTMDMAVDMEMKVNATGSSVKISYPDLTKFPDIASAAESAPESSAGTTSAGSLSSFVNR